MNGESTGSTAEARRALDAAGWPEVAESLIRGLVHDLSGLAGTIPELASAVGEPDPDDELRELLVGEARRLPGLVRRLREVVHEPNGPIPIEVGRWLESVVALHGHHHGGHGRTVRVDLPPAVPPIRSDPELLRRLLLIAMAGRSEGGIGVADVSLTVRVDEGRVRIQVEGPEADPERDRWLVEAGTRLGAELLTGPAAAGKRAVLALRAM